MKKSLIIIALLLGVTKVNAQSQQVNFGNSAMKNRTEWYRPNTPTNTDGNREVVGWIKAWDCFYMSMDTIRFDVLTGTGNRMVMAKSNGDMYTQDFNWTNLGSKPTLFDGQYSSLTGLPTLFNGDYNSLTNKPTIPSAQVQTDWNASSGMGQILNKPILFSGVYADLSGKPTLFDGQYSSLTGLPSLFSGSYLDLSNKPTIPTNTNQLTNGSGFIVNLSSFSTSNLNEGANLYFTNTRARSAISATGSISYNSTTGVISSTAKKQETFSGTTSGSGTYTVTFGTAYSVAPNIQANIVGASDSQIIKITSITTTGFTVTVRNRTDVVGLLPTWSNVNGANVDVLITEK